MCPCERVCVDVDLLVCVCVCVCLPECVWVGVKEWAALLRSLSVKSPSALNRDGNLMSADDLSEKFQSTLKLASVTRLGEISTFWRLFYS